jgi:hydroxymethylpyrimidine pyrophosphatase-like HAD family hydrolase
MKHIDELRNIEGVNLVVFDVDGVIVPRGTRIIEEEGMVTYNLKFPPQKFIDIVKQLLEYTNVAISSGRSMLTLKTMFSELLGEERNGNVFLMQAENGGRISWGVDEMGAGHDSGIMKQLGVLRKRLREIKHENIRGFEPKESILTLHCHDRVPDVEQLLENYPHYIIWNGEAYDIGENGISKGSGLGRMKRKLSEVLGKDFKTIAIGDRENDIELLEQADISVSADRERLKDAQYYIDEAEDLPGVILAERLLGLFRER